MTSIPVNGLSGTILGLEVVPAADGSNNLVPVVQVQNASDITLGSVTFTGELPAGTNTIGKVTLAEELPPGTNTIGGTFPTPTASAGFAITPGSSSILEASHVLKAAPGNLYSLYVITTSVSGYLMTFNSTTVPPDGPVTPVECIPVGRHSIAGIGVDGSPPDHYTNGIVAVFSTTGPFTKTTQGFYGSGPYGAGPYGHNPTAGFFFKWCVQ